jgi:4-amino-4-deoxy-L-arabinose transferase-like glycosyltransferase
MTVAEAGGAVAPLLDRAVRRTLPWEKIGLAVLLTATAASFLWGLDRNGWANPYYSAATQAGSQDWKAFFYGSLDAGNLITVDKPPLSIWIMSLSVRLFGLNSWALLVPQALMGVATTWLIYRIIRRSHPAAPALLGGLIYATTPVVVLMSRYNNPEPLMGLLTVAAVYFVLRAIEDNRLAWYLIAGTSLGLGFMAKQIQAFLPIPALVLAVLLFGAGTVASRLLRLLASLAALIISGGWWTIVVELTPAANRPYVGGSATNSIFELTLDYNGLARFVRLPITSAGASTEPELSEAVPYDSGLTRLFNGNFAPEAAWLLFSALAIVLVLGVLHYLLSTQPARLLALMAGAWLVSAYLILSFMGTMVHTYYTYSLAPPIALLMPVGLLALWQARSRLPVRLIGAAVVFSSAYMSYRILEYSDDYPTWLRFCISILGLLSTVGWMVGRKPQTQRVLWTVVACGLIVGPLATNVHTLSNHQKGTNPLSGPISNDPDAISRHLEEIREGKPAWARQIAYGEVPDAEVIGVLSPEASDSTWIAATYSAENAAQYQLATGRPVMALGGWLGTDPAPTLEQFQLIVEKRQVTYFIWQQDLMDLQQLGPETVKISEWVSGNFRYKVVGGVKIYDFDR